MARIPRLRSTKIQDDPKSFGASVNDWAGHVAESINGTLNFEDNFDCVVKTIRYNSTDVPISVSLDGLIKPPSAVLSLRAQQEGSDGTMISGSIVTWKFTAPGNVSISNISGLSSSVYYQIKLLLLAGS